jgi:hypothetical protein
MPPAQGRSQSAGIYGGFVNPTNITYFMIGGPCDQQEITLPHPVKKYEPEVDGKEERYILADVNLFGHRLPVLLYFNLAGNEPRANDVLARGLLNHAALYNMWQSSPLSNPPLPPLPVPPIPSGNPADSAPQPQLANNQH